MHSGMFDLVGIPELINNFLLQTSTPSEGSEEVLESITIKMSFFMSSILLLFLFCFVFIDTVVVVK